MALSFFFFFFKKFRSPFNVFRFLSLGAGDSQVRLLFIVEVQQTATWPTLKALLTAADVSDIRHVVRVDALKAGPIWMVLPSVLLSGHFGHSG